MTLAFKLDLDILPLDLHAENRKSGPYVCPFGQESEADRQTHSHTHTLTRGVKTITPSADAGCNN